MTKAKASEEELVAGGAMPPSDFHDAIERLREIASYDFDLPPDFAARLDRIIEELVVSPDLIHSVAAAIRTGHVVLQGPPGTGKSTLARALAAAFNATIYAVTAHEDWTIYDVIGRLELQLNSERKEEIVPVNGAFTEAVIRCGNNVVAHFDDPLLPQAEWLFIDELNRAHLDKAFGELFSVLGTDELVPINLPHQKQGNRELVIPRRFRIIATLNSYDKQFVQSLSQAIRRRFTFITVDIPPKRPSGTAWQYNAHSTFPAIREFAIAIQRAAGRVARREASGSAVAIKERFGELEKLLSTSLLETVAALFDFAERFRYSSLEGDAPYLPIGTAQLIDTVELFLVRLSLDEGKSSPGQLMDWAVSVKLVPLFESDVLSPEKIRTFAAQLQPPFDRLTRRELLSIAAAGTHFVA